MSSVDINQVISVVELLARVGAKAIERRRERPMSAMSDDDVRRAARELLDEVRPWDEPVEGGPV